MARRTRRRRRRRRRTRRTELAEKNDNDLDEDKRLSGRLKRLEWPKRKDVFSG